MGLVALVGIAGIWAIAGPNAFDIHENWTFRRRYAMASAIGFGACLAVLSGSGSSPFLYFQF
jgi:hypothetical protein